MRLTIGAASAALLLASGAGGAAGVTILAPGDQVWTLQSTTDFANWTEVGS